MRTLPQDATPEFGELLLPRDDRREVVPGELASLACEHGRSVGKEKLHLASAAGVEQELTRRRVAGVVLVREIQAHVTAWNPHRLATPARVNELRPNWQHQANGGAGSWSALGLESSVERIRPYGQT
jgi:hypothetical protein